jgi:hypothetical protein
VATAALVMTMVAPTFAASLANTSVALSNTDTDATGVTATLVFQTPTGQQNATDEIVVDLSNVVASGLVDGDVSAQVTVQADADGDFDTGAIAVDTNLAATAASNVITIAADDMTDVAATYYVQVVVTGLTNAATAGSKAVAMKTQLTVAGGDIDTGSASVSLTIPGSESSTVELEITGGVVTIFAPSVLDFGSLNSSSSVVDQELDLVTYNGGVEYFAVEDLKSDDGGYHTTLSMSALTDGGTKSIAADKMLINLNSRTVTKISGDTNADVAIPAGLLSGGDTALDTPATVLARAAGANEGRVGKYGIQPLFTIEVPAYQPIAEYTGTMTYTLIED